MAKMAWNWSALHDVLAQGAYNRDITVYTKCITGIKAFYSIKIYSTNFDWGNDFLPDGMKLLAEPIYVSVGFILAWWRHMATWN